VKITFEGKTLLEVFEQMEGMLNFHRKLTEPPLKIRDKAHYDSLTEVPPVQKSVAKPVDIPVRTAVEVPPAKPPERFKRERTAKQLENDERLRVAAKAKLAAKKAAKVQTLDTASMMPMPPPPATAEGMDPAEVVRIRQKTIEELQAAYANGFQKEVFELLSRFGNGAKSFRELPVEAFVPIREAIDNGALT
jgi:hypothetical protein